MDNVEWKAPDLDTMYIELIWVLSFLVLFVVFLRVIPFVGIKWRDWMSKRKRREGQAVLLADHIVEHLESEVASKMMSEEDAKWWYKLLQNSTPHELSQQFKPRVLTKLSPPWDVKSRIQERLGLDADGKKKPYFSKLDAAFARFRKA